MSKVEDEGSKYGVECGWGDLWRGKKKRGLEEIYREGELCVGIEGREWLWWKKSVVVGLRGWNWKRLG